MRSGVRIWVESDRADNLQEALKGITQHKFIYFEGESFNTADLEGVYKAKTVEELTRRKNGQWQCAKGSWHDKFQDCSCKAVEETSPYAAEPEITEEERARNIAALGKLRGSIKPVKPFPKTI